MNKVEVRIAGKEYTLRGGESPEYMQKVALYVDRKTIEIIRVNSSLSTSMASVLTAVNITDEMFKLLENRDNLKKEVDQASRIIMELKKEKADLTQSLQKTMEENKYLTLELAKREAELSEVRNSINRAGNNSKNYKG